MNNTVISCRINKKKYSTIEMKPNSNNMKNLYVKQTSTLYLYFSLFCFQSANKYFICICLVYLGNSHLYRFRLRTHYAK